MLYDEKFRILRSNPTVDDFWIAKTRAGMMGQVGSI